MATAFFARTKGKMERIFFRDILYITAKKNYSEIILSCGRKICVSVPLSGLLEQLPSKIFCRIHRSHVVCTEHIEAFDHNHVWLAKEKLPIGRTYFEQLTKELIIISGEHDASIRKDVSRVVTSVFGVDKSINHRTS